MRGWRGLVGDCQVPLLRGAFFWGEGGVRGWGWGWVVF